MQSCADFITDSTPHSGALSLSPNGRFVATFGLSKFEVQKLNSASVQRLQWQGPIAQPELARRSSVCFAHEGFAVAGAAGESRVHVWDAECGDWLLFLDHGGMT
jgi:WD40 repeat protein